RSSIIFGGRDLSHPRASFPNGRCLSLKRHNVFRSSKGSCRRGHSSTEAKCERTEGQAKAYRSANRRSLEGRRVLSTSQGIHRPGESCRSCVRQEIQRKAFSGMLRPLRFPPRLGQALAQDTGHEQPALLEMVRRRKTQRLLQLRRPPPP